MLPNMIPDAGKSSPRHALNSNGFVEKKRISTQEKVLLTKKGIKVIGNRDTKRYHLPGMKYFDKVKENHRVVFASEKEAIVAGYHKAQQ